MSGTLSAANRRLLDHLGAKYLWWERARIGALPERRIVAQVMDVGSLEDVETLIGSLGDDRFVDVLTHASPGWFRPRSWSYWHLRLGLRQPGEPNPPLPVRSFR